MKCIQRIKKITRFRRLNENDDTWKRKLFCTSSSRFFFTKSLLVWIIIFSTGFLYGFLFSVGKYHLKSFSSPISSIAIKYNNSFKPKNIIFTNKVNENILMTQRQIDRIQYEYKKRHSKFYKNQHELFPTNCEPMYSWQVISYPTCNTLHEFDLSNLYPTNNRIIANGGFRTVWTHEMDLQTLQVVKTLHYEHNFTYEKYEQHRVDSISMNVLHSSDNIANMYAYCSTAGIYEYTAYGTMDDHIWEYGHEWSGSQKLKIAWQISKAITDVHSIGRHSPSIAHTDITPLQFLWFDGVYKLNDFNRAQFISWNNNKSQACPFRIPFAAGPARAPEEYRLGDLTEKVDIYQLSTIFYNLLTGIEPFQDRFKLFNSEELKSLIINGTRPKIPSKFLKGNREEKAIIYIMKKCWISAPEKRPTSQEIESYLRKKMKEYSINFFM